MNASISSLLKHFSMHLHLYIYVVPVCSCKGQSSSYTLRWTVSMQYGQEHVNAPVPGLDIPVKHNVAHNAIPQNSCTQS